MGSLLDRATCFPAASAFRVGVNPDAAHQRHHHLVYLLQGDHVFHCRVLCTGEFARSGNRTPHVGGLELLHLFLEQSRVHACREANNLKLIREGADYVQRLAAYGACGPQNNDSSHSPNTNAGK